MSIYVQAIFMAMPMKFFILFFLWYSMWRHYVCSGHLHSYFLKLGQVDWASAQSIFFRCQCFHITNQTVARQLWRQDNLYDDTQDNDTRYQDSA